MKSGSMGFSIPTSPTKIKINFSNKNHDEIIFNKENTKLQDGVFKLLAKFKKTTNTNTKYTIIIELPDTFKHHQGLGLTTQILGSVLMCLYKINSLDFNINILLQYNIGNRSGLGARLLLSPNFIIEMGYKPSQNGFDLHPEFYDTKELFEDSIFTIKNCPWQAIIAIPHKDTSLSGRQEQKFSEITLPDNPKNAFLTTYQVFHNIIPSLLENDFQRFINSLQIITALGNKAAEEKIQSQNTQQALKVMRKSFGFAAISSLGPTIYSFTNQANYTLPILDNYHIHVINLGDL